MTNDAHYFYEKKQNFQTKVTPHEDGGRKITYESMMHVTVSIKSAID